MAMLKKTAKALAEEEKALEEQRRLVQELREKVAQEEAELREKCALLVGDVVLDMMESDPMLKRNVRDQLDERLTKVTERKLFDLPRKPKGEREKGRGAPEHPPEQ